MCGIAAIFAYHSDAPPVDETELLRIRERMINRGPDGAGGLKRPKPLCLMSRREPSAF